MTQRHRQSSIDGFISNNGGRQVGFNAGQAPIRGRTITPQTRVRRPGLHSAQTARDQHYNANIRQSVVANNNPLNRAANAYNPKGSFGGGESTLPTDNNPKPKRGLFGRKRQAAPAAPSGRQRGRRPGSGAGAAQNRGNFFQRTNWKKVFKRTGLLILLLVLIGGGWFSWKIFQNSKRVFGDSNILGFLNATKLKGEDKGHVNILMAGVSTDDAGHQGADLTDSIMLISVDTVNKKAFMLSIPRDLWVDIPSYGHSKINAANAYGDGDNYSQPGYPSGGMGLLEQVLSENLEIPIHYYAKVNYSALRDAVNAVGGVTVNIKSDDPRGLYDPNISWVDKGPLKLPNGVQTLDGQTALNLARARGDPTGDGRVAYGFAKSDFTRTENQRMLLLGLKEKIASGSTFANPVKLSGLLDTVGKNTKTDLQPGEVRRLYDLGKQIDSSKIQSLSLNDANGVNLLASYRTSEGASALIPAAGVDDFSDIQLFVKKAMSSDASVLESAKIVILNGGDTGGLATKYSNLLTSQDLNVVAVGDAPHQEGASVIIDLSQGKKPATKAKLQSQFGNNVTTTNTTGYADADFVVILGSTQKAPASSTDSNDNGQ